MPAEDLCDRSAVELAAMLRTRTVSAREVLAAHLARIERTNPDVNGIVTLTPELAEERAAAADESAAAGAWLGQLHGLPIAHKDLVQTAGIRTTFGSPIFAEHVPTADDLLVTRCRDAGAVLLGKTNTPEFGAGSHTFNPVFGVTRNPWDRSRSAGGSSGGAAAALATGMVPLADGSDLGGSLRNPASFCGVVGFRPSLGRVPWVPWPVGPDDLSVLGPMGRTVADVALLFASIAGPDPREPSSRPEPGASFAPPLAPIDRRPRVAWAPAADGAMPFEDEVVAAVDGARPVFERLGAHLEDAFPDLAGARAVFLTTRAKGFAEDLGSLLAGDRDRIKATVVWEIERGRAITDDHLVRARETRAAIDRRVAAFFRRFDALVLPVSQVAPFPVEQEYPTAVAGVPMETYLDWMESCWAITVTGCPSLAVRCGTTAAGLPVGLQIVGAPGEDLAVLRLGAAFERARDA